MTERMQHLHRLAAESKGSNLLAGVLLPALGNGSAAAAMASAASGHAMEIDSANNQRTGDWKEVVRRTVAIVPDRQFDPVATVRRRQRRALIAAMPIGRGTSRRQLRTRYRGQFGQLAPRHALPTSFEPILMPVSESEVGRRLPPTP